MLLAASAPSNVPASSTVGSFRAAKRRSACGLSLATMVPGRAMVPNQQQELQWVGTVKAFISSSSAVSLQFATETRRHPERSPAGFRAKRSRRICACSSAAFRFTTLASANLRVCGSPRLLQSIISTFPHSGVKVITTLYLSDAKGLDREGSKLDRIGKQKKEEFPGIMKTCGLGTPFPRSALFLKTSS